MAGLIKNNFALFLAIIIGILVYNPLILFKIVNNFQINPAEEKVFQKYLMDKKVINLKKEKINREALNNPLLFSKKAREYGVFNEKVFIKKVKNFVNWRDKLMAFLGFLIIFVVFKFFKNVRL